jgi:hypothetical protein
MAIISKGAVALIILALIAYWGASYFNVVPGPVNATVSWVSANMDALLVFFGFVIGCYVVLQVKRKGNHER